MVGRFSVASRTHILRDRALIHQQMRIFLESAASKLYENAFLIRQCGKYMKRKDERPEKVKHRTDREFVEVLIFPSKRVANNAC